MDLEVIWDPQDLWGAAPNCGACDGKHLLWVDLDVLVCGSMLIEPCYDYVSGFTFPLILVLFLL